MPKLFNNATNKQGLIVFGGEASSDYGMVVAEAPSFDRAVRKQTVYTVPGRNGSILFQEDAWEDVTRSYDVWLVFDEISALNEKVDALEAWLNSKTGYTRLEDNFEPDVYRLAYYSGGNNFSNDLTMKGEATLTFTCRPERFLKIGEKEDEISNGSVLYNPTKFKSKPLIHIEGSGNVTIGTGGNTLTITGLVDYINIDCERMNAYRQPGENKNSLVSGSFLKMAPGDNTFAITGGATKVTITPRYFTI